MEAVRAFPGRGLFRRARGACLVFLCVALALGACAIRAPVATASSRSPSRPVWLVSNGFHAALVIRGRDAPSAWGARMGNRVPNHVLLGWGDATFYRANRVTFSMAWKAAFSVNPSALHVMPFQDAVATRFAHSDVIRLELSSHEFAVLRRWLDDAFARGADGQPVLLGPGPKSHSRFYAGREQFYFPKVCNVWTARALREAGVPLFVPTAVTAGDLIWQAEKLGRREQWKRLPLDAF